MLGAQKLGFVQQAMTNPQVMSYVEQMLGPVPKAYFSNILDNAKRLEKMKNTNEEG